MEQRCWKASGCVKLFRVLKKFKFPLVTNGKLEGAIVSDMTLQKSGTSNLTSEALWRLARHLVCKY